MSDFRLFIKTFIFSNELELNNIRANNKETFEYLKTKQKIMNIQDFTFFFLIYEPLNYFKQNEDEVIIDKGILKTFALFIDEYSTEEYIYSILDNYEDDILKSYKYFKKNILSNNEIEVYNAISKWQYESYDNFLNEILELFKKYLKKKINE